MRVLVKCEITSPDPLPAWRIHHGSKALVCDVGPGLAGSQGREPHVNPSIVLKLRKIASGSKFLTLYEKRASPR